MVANPRFIIQNNEIIALIIVVVNHNILNHNHTTSYSRSNNFSFSFVPTDPYFSYFCNQQLDRHHTTNSTAYNPISVYA
jgi:hypothetical protein